MKETAKFLYDITKAKFVNVDREENAFESTINRFLLDWQKQVVRRYDAKITKAMDNINPEDVEAIANFKIGSLPKRLASLAAAAAQKGLERAYMDMNVALAWDIEMSPIADFYLQHYAEFSRILSSNLQVRVKELVANAVREGTPTDEVHQQIADIFAGPVTIKVPEKTNEAGDIIRRAYEYNMNKDSYTTMVARSEIQRALNNGRVYGYQESNIVKSLRWVANPGACELCLPHNGEVHKTEDSQDLIPLHPNCRCTWVVSEYKDFGEGTDSSPDKFADPEKIVADPDGVGIMEFFKLDDAQYKKVNELIDAGKEEEALKILRSKTQ